MAVRRTSHNNPSVAATLAEFEITAAGAKAFSNVNYSTIAVQTTDYLNARRSSSGAQNDEAVFLLPLPLTAGTWSIVLLHRQGAAAGIYTISVSPDASVWTDLTTVDGYNAANASTRTEVTGLTVAASMRYVRLKMAAKNASSSAFNGQFNMIAGLRTGA